MYLNNSKLFKSPNLTILEVGKLKRNFSFESLDASTIIFITFSLME